MKKPPIPTDESSRIKNLRSLDILDSPPEEKFDLITRLTAQVFNVPIALISLVDTERQWFKSKHGIEVEQTSRDASFCAHAIAKPISEGSDKIIFEVEDALEDERFRDNTLVVGEPYIRFYAGFVLLSRENYKLGTLCIIDKIPRKLSSFEKESFYNLGMLAQSQLQSFKLIDDTSTTKHYITTRED
jgi:GAF domain-containing protein